jgi:AraC-like DNA-binding protein
MIPTTRVRDRQSRLTKNGNVDEWSRFYRDPGFHDLGVLHAHFDDHQFNRHAHDHFVIAAIEWGAQGNFYRGERLITPAGQVFIANPDEVHTGEAVADEGYVYRTMYPRIELVRQIAVDLGGAPSRTHVFAGGVINDRALMTLLSRFHAALASAQCRLKIESLLYSALAYLVVHQGETKFLPRSASAEPAAVRRARDFIEVHYAESISLTQLGSVVSLSPFHFARAFQKQVGLPPHAYLETVRIRKARESLDKGERLVDVALNVGYSDQSHFTHRFRRVLGITPGQYLHGRKILQDSKESSQ